LRLAFFVGHGLDERWPATTDAGGSDEGTPERLAFAARRPRSRGRRASIGEPRNGTIPALLSSRERRPGAAWTGRRTRHRVPAPRRASDGRSRSARRPAPPRADTTNPSMAGMTPPFPRPASMTSDRRFRLTMCACVLALAVMVAPPCATVGFGRRTP
jgi:hypothetical protein